MLDAVNDYGGELLLVVENKVAESDMLPASELNFTGAKVKLSEGQEAVVVVWRDLLDAVVALRERGLVAPGRGIVARGSLFRQNLRLRAAWEATGSEARDSSYAPFVRMPAGSIAGANAYLRIHDDERRVELPSSLRALRRRSTAVRPGPPISALSSPRSSTAADRVARPARRTTNGGSSAA